MTARAGPGPAWSGSDGPSTSAFRPAVRLTVAQALVTLDFTRWGLTRKNFKICMLLLAAVIALAVGWSDLPHLLFGILLACVGIGALPVALSRSAWRQAHRVEAQLPKAKAAPQGRVRRAEARAAKRAEAPLSADAIVTLSDERDAEQPRFANGRSVRNELERARLRHAHRLASEPRLGRSRDDLMRLASADILTSPIFSLLGIEE